MAKSARASSKKNNRQALRSKVFQPVVDERTERLHAKLMSTIESEIPSKVNKTAMDVDEAETDPNEAGESLAHTYEISVLRRARRRDGR